MNNQYITVDEKVHVFIRHQGKLFDVKFDLEDLPRVLEHYKGVTLSMNGSHEEVKYAGSRFTPQRYLHRFIMALEDSDRRHVDHIDRNPLNNCKSNLRVLSARQNSLNRRVRTNTGLRYIHKLENGLFEFRFHAKKEGIKESVGALSLEGALYARNLFIQANKHKLPDHRIAVPEFQ